ncbi:MAG: hypothetical protein JSW10_08190 [Pseudomonadota bacterium]|nr:MAG: hypothetical protein JSW10_08190 [Pseudomonadota bacterium]
MKKVTAVAGLLLMLAAFAQGHAASAADGKWNQQKITGLAIELAETVKRIRHDPGLRQPQSGIVQQRMYDAALLDLERLERLTDELAEALKDGQGFLQTRPTFQRILDQRQNILDYVRTARVAESVEKTAYRFRQLLDELATYYQIEFDPNQ